MKIKFIKEYLFNKKDTIINLDNSNAKRLIDGGFAEETKENLKQSTKKVAKKKVVAKKVNENKCKGCGDIEIPCDDCKEETKK